MATARDILSNMKVDAAKKIRGVTVRRESDGFLIDGMFYDIDEAIEQLEQRSSARGLPYSELGFVMMDEQRVVSTHQCKNRQQHLELLAKAKAKGHHLYYSTVSKKNGRYFLNRPLIIDWDSVQDGGEEPQIDDSNSLKCPFCGKEVSSTPGRTLHVKSKHPDKLEAYYASLERSD